MYEVSLEAGGRLLIAKASGLLQADDYDAMLEFEKLVSAARPEGMLVDWTELKGWSEESESMRFLARMQFGATLQRIAILADSSWDPDIERVRDVTRLPVRRFPPSDLESAKAWLKSDAS